MKLIELEIREHAVPLTRPYAIAYKSLDSVEIISVRLLTDAGTEGLGAASPAPAVTGETLVAARDALKPDRIRGLLDFVHQSDAREIAKILAPAFSETPAAGAALDMALLDIWSKEKEKPLAEALGRHHTALPTSITIGIRNIEATLSEAAEYVARGFRHLKVKLGHSLEEDIERLRRLREVHRSNIMIRVDANQGYSMDELRTFFARTAKLDIEFIEQPLKTLKTKALKTLGPGERKRVALDESLRTPEDAAEWAQPLHPAGIYNIKLMKCGGVTPALEIARIAERARIDLMWGCMDESCVGIAAALHAAFASPSTRYLDLDGSLDLARDFATGGFEIEEGVMRTLDVPGLGVRFA